MRDTFHTMNSGKLILVIGPTGSGKSMLMKHAIATFPELVLPFSYTTRARRADAIENSHYKFVDKAEFQERVEKGEFLEWAEYGGNFYGTLKAEIELAVAEGKILLKEMEVQGARQTKEILSKEELLTVYVDAGSWEELERRVLSRAHMDEAELLARRKRYEDEVTFIPEVDVVISNAGDDREHAKNEFVHLIQSVLDTAKS